MSDKIEKVLDLVEKMYFELQDTKKEVQNNSNHIMRIEKEMSDKFGMLFDAQKAFTEAQKSTEERLERIENKLDALSDKVDSHDIKIQVIEGGKKKKAK